MTQISAHITRTTEQPAPQLDPSRMWFRGLHPAEGGRQPSQLLQSPEIIPPYSPTVALELTKSIQLMSYDLAAHFHPAIRADREKWKIINNHSYCMNNGTQNGYPSSKDETPVPHIDYVTAYPDVQDPQALPLRTDKMYRTFSGSLISGKLDGKVIWCTPGIDAIDARDFGPYIPGTPEAAAILKNIINKRWFSYAVADGHGTPFRMGGHWGDGWVVFPFILDRPVSYWAAFFERWTLPYAPEPTRIYSPVGGGLCTT